MDRNFARAVLLVLALSLYACQTSREIDPTVERDAICSMLTCGR